MRRVTAALMLAALLVPSSAEARDNTPACVTKSKFNQAPLGWSKLQLDTFWGPEGTKMENVAPAWNFAPPPPKYGDPTRFVWFSYPMCNPIQGMYIIYKKPDDVHNYRISVYMSHISDTSKTR